MWPLYTRVIVIVLMCCNVIVVRGDIIDLSERERCCTKLKGNGENKDARVEHLLG